MQQEQDAGDYLKGHWCAPAKDFLHSISFQSIIQNVILVFSQYFRRRSLGARMHNQDNTQARKSTFGKFAIPYFLHLA